MPGTQLPLRVLTVPTLDLGSGPALSGYLIASLSCWARSRSTTWESLGVSADDLAGSRLLVDPAGLAAGTSLPPPPELQRFQGVYSYWVSFPTCSNLYLAFYNHHR